MMRLGRPGAAQRGRQAPSPAAGGLAGGGRQAGVLYIMYGSLLSPLGQRQVLPYVAGLARLGFRMAILSFEARGTPLTSHVPHAGIEAQNIAWLRCTYHAGSSLPLKLADVGAGLVRALRLARARRIDIVHARSDLPALLGYLLKKLIGCRLLYDVRGLLADEYLDAGHWRAGSFTYRLTRAVERRLRAEADATVVLTERIRRYLHRVDVRGDSTGEWPIVIPCCVDTTAFQPGAADPELARRLGLEGRTVLVYSGSLSTWYMPEEMLRFFSAACRVTPKLAMLILTQEAPELALAQAHRLGISPDSLVVHRAPPAEVPRYLRLAHFGISFIRATFSKQASSPTKIAEYLATGLPLCVNSGVGDIDDLVTAHGLGVLVREFSEVEYQRRWRELLAADSPQLRSRCREVAVTELDLSEGVRRYAGAYRRLACTGRRSSPAALGARSTPKPLSGYDLS